MQQQRISPIFILLQLSLVFLHEVISVPFQPVSTSCIYWDPLKIYPNGHSEKLHCIMDEKNQLGIVNVTWKLVPSGYCPYFDRYSDVVNLKPCDEELGRCPEQPIYSYQAVKYSACYSTQPRNESHLNTKESDEQDITSPYLPNIQYINNNCHTSLISFTVLSVSMLSVILGLSIYSTIQQRKMMKRERSSEHSNSHFEVDAYPVEQNVNDPLLENPFQAKDDTDGMMNLCLKLVKVQFEKEKVDLGVLATDIPEEEREHMREKLQKAVNALSPIIYRGN